MAITWLVTSVENSVSIAGVPNKPNCYNLFEPVTAMKQPETFGGQISKHFKNNCAHGGKSILSVPQSQEKNNCLNFCFLERSLARVTVQTSKYTGKIYTQYIHQLNNVNTV